MNINKTCDRCEKRYRLFRKAATMSWKKILYGRIKKCCPDCLGNESLLKKESRNS